MSEARADFGAGRRWAERIAAFGRQVSGSGLVAQGRLDRMVGMTLEAVGCEAAVGARCLIDASEGSQVEAEVVGFSGERLFLMPTADVTGLTPGAPVVPTRRVSEARVGEALLGRVIDGAGRPLDGMPEPACDRHVVQVCVLQLVSRVKRNDAKHAYAGNECLDFLSEAIAKVLVFLVAAHVGERQDRDRLGLGVPEFQRQLVKTESDRDRNRDNDEHEGHERQSPCTLVFFSMTDDTAQRNVVSPRQDHRDRQTQHDQYDQHGHGVVRNRQALERNVGHLQQHPGYHAIGYRRAKHAAAA